jgi:hypothetical protein
LKDSLAWKQISSPKTRLYCSKRPESYLRWINKAKFGTSSYRYETGARALDAHVVRVALKIVKFIDVNAVARIADDIKQKCAFALLCFRRAASHNQITYELNLFFFCKEGKIA